MASDHTLYSPKPAYDQLDQYRVGSAARGPGRGVEEKTRRSGITTITPQVGSDSEESEQDGPQLILPTRIRLPRHQEVEVAPLSPPPSLDNVEEEEEEEEEEKRKKKRELPNREKPPLLKQKTQSEERVEVEEEEPLLPSTPESGSSINSAELFSRITQGGTRISGRGPLMRQPSMTTPEDPPVTTPPHTPTTTTPTIVNTMDKLPIETAVSVRSERSKSCSGVFPSLQDQHLRSSGLARDEPIPNENLSAQEIENKFNQLSLAFRTDGVTLRQRLDLQQRHRDNAETNFNRELAALRDSLVVLHTECLDTELVDAVSVARRNLDILATANTRLLSNSEVWGAVQQEWRVSRAVEVLLLHVENVKRMYEREHQELEELRRLLNEYQIELPITTSQPAQDAPTISRRVRALSLAVCQSSSNKPQQETRRTSMTTSGPGRPGSFTGARTRRRASLQPDQLKPFRDQFALAAAAVASSAAAASSAGGGSGGKGKGQEGGESSSKGMLGITEEGSIDEESGDESTSQNPSSPPAATTTLTTNTTTAITTTTTPTTMSPLTQLPPGTESECRSSQDLTASSISHDAEPRPAPPDPTLLPHRQDSLVYLAVQHMVGAAGEWWPYSTQDTVSGVRYVVTSVLALLVLCLLLALCSGSSELPEPRHPGWVNIALIRHPFVTLRYRGIRPY